MVHSPRMDTLPNSTLVPPTPSPNCSPSGTLLYLACYKVVVGDIFFWWARQSQMCVWGSLGCSWWSQQSLVEFWGCGCWRSQERQIINDQPVIQGTLSLLHCFLTHPKWLLLMHAWSAFLRCCEGSWGLLVELEKVPAKKEVFQVLGMSAQLHFRILPPSLLLEGSGSGQGGRDEWQVFTLSQHHLNQPLVKWGLIQLTKG